MQEMEASLELGGHREASSVDVDVSSSVAQDHISSDNDDADRASSVHSARTSEGASLHVDQHLQESGV